MHEISGSPAACLQVHYLHMGALAGWLGGWVGGGSVSIIPPQNITSVQHTNTRTHTLHARPPILIMKTLVRCTLINADTKFYKIQMG